LTLDKPPVCHGCGDTIPVELAAMNLVGQTVNIEELMTMLVP
jgi:hypothetical protein